MAERELFPANNRPALEKPEPAQEEEKQITRPHAQPVAKRLKGKKEETFGQKFTRTFFDENINDIGEYLVKDLIIPRIKDVIIDFVTAALVGNRQSGSYRSGDKSRTYYNRISNAGRVGISERSRREREDRSRERDKVEFNLDDIVFGSKAQAESVLSKMNDYLCEYGQVTVGYLLELLDESSTYTDEYYGWRDLDRAYVQHVRNGYSLELPRPVRIEK